MKLGQFYKEAVKLGKSCDPRGVQKLDNELKELKNKYRKLKGDEKKEFDLESLTNPYADTRILYGDPDTEIKKILAGIDMEVPEILLADKIRENEGLDLVLSHHPEGIAFAGLNEVMTVHIEVLTKAGIKHDIAKALMDERMKEVQRKISSANHSRPVDAARLLDMPFICCHTVADNFVASYLEKLLDTKKTKTVDDVLKVLKQIPEYKEATLQKAGPKIILGKPQEKCGKILVDMTGGTEGSKEVFARLSQAGIGTLVCMHLSEEHFQKAKPEHLNVIIAGHIASDNLGLNLLLDKLQEKEKFEIISCSGFRRIKHIKHKI